MKKVPADPAETRRVAPVSGGAAEPAKVGATESGAGGAGGNPHGDAVGAKASHHNVITPPSPIHTTVDYPEPPRRPPDSLERSV